MILSGNADYFTATAGTTTMTASNMIHQQQQQQQSQQQHQQSDEVSTDFGWWQTQQSVNGLTGHQFQQITSSLPSQQQQFSTGDEFDGFDLSLLISGITDGLYNDGASDNRVPAAAAISATVTVHTNTVVDGNANYNPSTTTVPQQLQLDLQQLWSLYEEIRQSEISPSPAAVVPSVIDTTDEGTTAMATVTTTVATANDGDSNTTKSALLRSLLTATVPSSPPSTVKNELAAPVVESTSGTAAAPSAVINIKTETKEATDNKNNNKHRLLIEMLRGSYNDNVVVPTAVIRPTRRRSHAKAFGPDDVDECKVGRRRLDALSAMQTDQVQGFQPSKVDDDGLLLYENHYFTASCASSSWLDHLVDAAAAATTDEYNLCFDQVNINGSYYSATTTENVYSPPAAAQVPSVSPPPSSCEDPSTTTIVMDDCSRMDEQMCWKTEEGTTGSGDFYDRVLMFIKEEAATANDDTAISSCITSSGKDSINSFNRDSNSNSSMSNTNKISLMESNQDDGSIVSADSEDVDVKFPLQQSPKHSSVSSKSFTVTPGKVTAKVTTTTTSLSSSSLSSPSNIHLWQFMKEMLTTSEADDNDATSITTAAAGSTVHPKQPMIRWLDRKEGIFKIEDSQAVARLWGQRKNRPLMNYDKLSRSLRQYYKKGIMRKTARSQRLVYQFCYPYNA